MHDVFYFTDIHGDYFLYDAIINWCFEKDSEAHVIFGGDACDRGDYGYRIMRELLDNPQVGYLKGNHEELFVNAAHEIIGFCAQSDEIYNKLKSKDREFARKFCIDATPLKMPALSLCLYNGGARTIQDWIVDGADEDFVDTIENLPLTFSFGNLDFCHAGSTYEHFSKVAEAEYNGAMPDSESTNRLLWDRNLLALGWETGRIGIFGHTPTVSLPKGIYGNDQSLKNAHPCVWHDKMGEWSKSDKRQGLKVDMDTGAVWSHRAYVLNCLTGVAYCFFDEEHKDGNIIKIVDECKII